MIRPASLLDSLARFGHALPAVVRDISPADARWKPASGAWSIVEIVRHLVDEETEDFRRRIESTLTDASRPWPPIDPEGWAVARRYEDADLAVAAAEFQRLRAASVAWLRSLREPDWTATHQHPKFGPFAAGDLLAAWAAHDHLHLRQIAKRQFELAQRDAGEFTTRYAGEWGV